MYNMVDDRLSLLDGLVIRRYGNINECFKSTF